MRERLTREDLRHFAGVLPLRHDELAGDAAALEADAATGPDRPLAERPEEARLVRDGDRSRGLAARGEQELDLVRDALQRIDDGTYGVCESGGSWIDRERLQVVPEARYCLACEERLRRETPPPRATGP